MVGTLERAQMLEAEPEEVGLSSTKLNNVTRLVHGYINDGKIPGAISMIARRGKVVHFETYGKMDEEAGKPMTADTIFRIYSMTKPIASLGLMLLYEEGRFQLDDPAYKYIPEWKNQKVFIGGTADNPDLRAPERPISVRDLLMHTSGLAGGLGAPESSPTSELFRRAGVRGFGQEGNHTLRDMVERIANVPLQFDPGTKWNYGISTDVVGYLSEVLSGRPFDVYLKERIFDPLGMSDTGFSVPEASLDRFAACYRRGGENDPPYVLQDSPTTSPYAKPRTYFSGAGGLVSTAADYMRFCKMLANGGELDGVRIAGKRTIEFMAMNHLPGGCDLAAMGQTRFTETSMEGIGFGLGFAVLLDPAKAQIIGTPGEYYWGGAASTAFFINPKEDLIMIFLTQLLPSGSYPFRRELRATIYSSIID
ncbi:MAG TPA: serine hydrolase domain-containing protein [Dehalococcoidia bacterium]|nr:serine hydrolase domain-containing protein [Dehalococcoidia bacterium]